MYGRSLSKEEKQIILRFNKIFAQRGAELRREAGGIIADHASKGLLRSGASVKLFYAAMERQLVEGVTESLNLVSNKTSHSGRRRKRYLDQLRGQVQHAAKSYDDMLTPKVALVGAGEGDAKAAADRLSASCLAEALDRVDKYADGLTAPKDVGWHERNPLTSKAIMAGIAAVIGLLVGQVIGLFNLFR